MCEPRRLHTGFAFRAAGVNRIKFHLAQPDFACSSFEKQPKTYEDCLMRDRECDLHTLPLVGLPGLERTGIQIKVRCTVKGYGGQSDLSFEIPGFHVSRKPDGATGILFRLDALEKRGPFRGFFRKNA